MCNLNKKNKEKTLYIVRNELSSLNMAMKNAELK